MNRSRVTDIAEHKSPVTLTLKGRLGERPIILDFSALDYINSTGLRSLGAANRQRSPQSSSVFSSLRLGHPPSDDVTLVAAKRTGGT